MMDLQESKRVSFRGGRTGMRAVPSRYDVFAWPPESLALPVVPGYLGVVVRYADGTWLAVARNGSKGEARTRRQAVRRAWWWRYV